MVFSCLYEEDMESTAKEVATKNSFFRAFCIQYIHIEWKIYLSSS
jgi:hypothetical protein